MQSAGEYADPAVRLQQWVQGFGQDGLLFPICAASFAPAMTTVGQRIAKALGPRCFTGPVPVNPSACRAIDRYRNDQGKLAQTLLPACAANGNQAPCWQLAADAQRCPGETRFTVNRGGASVPNDLTTWVTCDPCPAGATTLGCR